MSAELSTDLRKELLEAVRRTVQTRLFDPAFNGRDWESLVRQREEAIVAAAEPTEFERRMESLLQALDLRPVGFSHETTSRVPIQRMLGATLFPYDASWMFQDVHEDGPAYAAGVRPGDVLVSVDEHQVTSNEPVYVSANRSTSLRIRKPDGSTDSVCPTPHDGAKRKPPIGLRKLPSGIGYLRINRFPGLVGIDMAHDIDSAVQTLCDCRAVIVDLRGNPGGGSANLRLMSYLTPKKLPVGYSLTRRRAECGYRREELPRFKRIPRSKLGLLWLAARYKFADKSIVVVTEGLKAPPFQNRIVLLVNEHTVSGSEIVVGFAKDHKLAAIAGTRTAGRLYGWSTFPLLSGYRLTIPVSNYLTWEGKCFERIGIEPDVEVPFSADSALTGRDEQLERAAEIAARL